MRWSSRLRQYEVEIHGNRIVRQSSRSAAGLLDSICILIDLNLDKSVQTSWKLKMIGGNGAVFSGICLKSVAER